MAGLLAGWKLSQKWHPFSVALVSWLEAGYSVEGYYIRPWIRGGRDLWGHLGGCLPQSVTMWLPSTFSDWGSRGAVIFLKTYASYKSVWANHEGDLQDKDINACVRISKGMPQYACVPATVRWERKRQGLYFVESVHSHSTCICSHSVKLTIKWCVDFSPASLLKTRFPGEAALGSGLSV